MLQFPDCSRNEALSATYTLFENQTFYRRINKKISVCHACEIGLLQCTWRETLPSLSISSGIQFVTRLFALRRRQSERSRLTSSVLFHFQVSTCCSYIAMTFFFLSLSHLVTVYSVPLYNNLQLS